MAFSNWYGVDLAISLPGTQARQGPLFLKISARSGETQRAEVEDVNLLNKYSSY